MKKHETTILNALLDQYERSKSFVGKNIQNQTFSKRITDLFPGYDDEANFELFSGVNSQVALLEKEGLITSAFISINVSFKWQYFGLFTFRKPCGIFILGKNIPAASGCGFNIIPALPESFKGGLSCP